jgi:lipoyl(octanoyl) transferase
MLMPDTIMLLTIEYCDIGLMEYKSAWDFQEAKHAMTVKNKDLMNNSGFAGFLIFCEHPNVFTLGKNGHVNNLLINEDFLKRIDASYYQSNRGGDITYHGPGQIVGYPVFNLEKMKIGVKEYIHRIEETIIQVLADYNIGATRLEGSTGVWLETEGPDIRKICAIGVRVSKAVTMHGFALNVNTDLKYFSYINPCGFLDKGVTSMEKELGKKPDFKEVKNHLKEKIVKVFSLKIS